MQVMQVVQVVQVVQDVQDVQDLLDLHDNLFSHKFPRHNAEVIRFSLFSL